MLLAFFTVAGLVVLWDSTAILSLSFQYKVPRPWITSGHRGFDRVTFFNTRVCTTDSGLGRFNTTRNGSINISTDLPVRGFLLWIVWGLRMKIRCNFVVVLIFCIRILCQYRSHSHTYVGEKDLISHRVRVEAVIQLVSLSPSLHTANGKHVCHPEVRAVDCAAILIHQGGTSLRSYGHGR